MSLLKLKITLLPAAVLAIASGTATCAQQNEGAPQASGSAYAGAGIPQVAVSPASSFVLARNGQAFLYDYSAGVIGTPFLKDVYKPFGFSPDARYFLYLKANGKFPTFSLYCYDLIQKTEKQVTAASVHHAVWSPTAAEFAYVWLDRAGQFHVSTHDVQSGADTEVVSGRVRPEFLDWSPNGAELLYVSVSFLTKRAFEDHQLGYTLHRYSLKRGIDVPVPGVEWAQFLGGQLVVLGKNAGAGLQRLANPKGEQINRFAVSGGQVYATVFEAGHEVVKRWNATTKSFDLVDRGSVYLANDRGVVIRDFTAPGVNYKYVPSGGAQATALITATDNWKMPFAGWANMVQGGASYTGGSCDGASCFITAHTATLGYDLDWQQMPENDQGNTHVVATDAGTVAQTMNSVTCNIQTPSCSIGWDDYSSTCNDPTGGIGNFVSVAHLDGTYSFYGHLKSGSVQVAPGDNVNQGTHLADQGHSGAAGTYNNYLNCGDHLHFGRQTGPAPWEQSVPTDFVELPCLLGCASAYQSANVELAGPPTLASVSPDNSIAGSNVQVTLTGANFVYGSTVNVSGSSITVSGVSLTSGSRITATFSVAGAAAAGSYSVTVTTPNGTSNSVPFNVPAVGGGGALIGSMVTPYGTQELTTLGGTDWAHWGLTSASDFNHKAGVSQQISNFSIVGAGLPGRYTNNDVGFTWTDGNPTPSATYTTTGVYIAGQNKGFRITAPADTSVRTLMVYVGLWSAQGRMVAQLSDGSAPDYTDTSLSNPTAFSPGVYTFVYSAASSGQTLTVTFTQNNATSGNVTLQAAALTGPPAPADFTVSATPAAQSVPAGTGTSYAVSVAAMGGFGGNVALSLSGLPSGAAASFTPSSITGSGSSTLNVSTGTGTPAGSYPLTITAASGSLTHTTNVTLTVTAVGVGGTLAGSLGSPSGVQQLTLLGTADWAHWGLSAATSYNHKAGVTPQISNYTVVGGGSASRYTNNAIGYTWTDGTPTVTATGTTTGIYISGQNRGFSITVPADTTVRTLALYVGLWNAQGKMVAHLSDSSAPDYTDTSLSSAGSILGTYTFTYSAGTVGQTLTLTYTQNNASIGNVTLQAATLQNGVASPDFSLSATPATRSIGTGSSTTYAIDVLALSGFSGSVSLSAGGLPGGATASFAPASVTGSGSSTLTVTTGAGTPAGDYPITITGLSGSLSHTANVTLTVTSVGVGGTLAGSLTAPSGVQQLTALGTADWAHWGLSSATSYNHKAGVTPQISNYSIVGGGSAARYTNNAIGYTWTDGTPTATATATTTGIYISGQNQGFRITLPADTTVRTVTLNVGLWNAQGKMVAHLSDSSAPDYTDTSLSNAGVALGTYTFTYSAGTVGQTLTLTYTQNNASIGNVTLQAATLVNGVPAPDFSLSATPATRSIAAGGSTTYTADVQALNGFSGSVSLSAGGLPSGASASFSPASVSGAGSSTMTVSTASGTAPGSYPVTITATSGSLSHTANVTLTVTAPADFSLSATPAAQTVVPGASASYAVTVAALNGFSGSVALSAGGLPSGTAAGFSPSSVAGSGSSTMTVTTSAGTPAGSYPLTITGTSGGLSHTAGVTLTVSAVGVGGVLSGSIATPSGTQQLTLLGSVDWAHWGTGFGSQLQPQGGRYLAHQQLHGGGQRHAQQVHEQSCRLCLDRWHAYRLRHNCNGCLRPRSEQRLPHHRPGRRVRAYRVGIRGPVECAGQVGGASERLERAGLCGHFAQQLERHQPGRVHA